MRGGRAVHQCPGLHRGDAPDVPDRLFACPPCWYELPTPLQNRILRARRGSDEHWAAMHDAHQWYIAERDVRMPRPTS